MELDLREQAKLLAEISHAVQTNIPVLEKFAADYDAHMRNSGIGAGVGALAGGVGNMLLQKYLNRDSDEKPHTLRDLLTGGLVGGGLGAGIGALATSGLHPATDASTKVNVGGNTYTGGQIEAGKKLNDVYNIAGRPGMFNLGTQADGLGVGGAGTLLSLAKRKSEGSGSTMANPAASLQARGGQRFIRDTIKQHGALPGLEYAGNTGVSDIFRQALEKISPQSGPGHASAPKPVAPEAPVDPIEQKVMDILSPPVKHTSPFPSMGKPSPLVEFDKYTKELGKATVPSALGLGSKPAVSAPAKYNFLTVPTGESSKPIDSTALRQTIAARGPGPVGRNNADVLATLAANNKKNFVEGQGAALTKAIPNAVMSNSRAYDTSKILLNLLTNPSNVWDAAKRTAGIGDPIADNLNRAQ